MDQEDIVEALERHRRHATDETRRRTLEHVEDGFRRGDLSTTSVQLALIGVHTLEVESYLAAQ